MARTKRSLKMRRKTTMKNKKNYKRRSMRIKGGVNTPPSPIQENDDATPLEISDMQTPDFATPVSTIHGDDGDESPNLNDLSTPDFSSPGSSELQNSGFTTKDSNEIAAPKKLFTEDSDSEELDMSLETTPSPVPGQEGSDVSSFGNLGNSLDEEPAAGIGGKRKTRKMKRTKRNNKSKKARKHRRR